MEHPDLPSLPEWPKHDLPDWQHPELPDLPDCDWGCGDGGGMLGGLLSKWK
jgi:hypothetical protein